MLGSGLVECLVIHCKTLSIPYLFLARYMFKVDDFLDSVDRWTMEVTKQQNGIINLLASHDYLGYSVKYGRFGFW